MYVAIDEYNRNIMAEIVDISTKYKTVDRKIKPVAVPLPKDSWKKMKEVANDPSLRDLKAINRSYLHQRDERKGTSWEGEFPRP